MAAEDVRVAVRVSRTAANARAATSSAAFSAQSACERGEFLNLDEARAAQTRVSISQSHAIHAAVVEHEAKTVKRRATLALAHDVKTWNVHRKREMLRLCLEQARSKHEATRRSVDAWSTLRDGFIGTPVNPSVVERRPISTTQPALETRPPVDPGEATTRIYDSVFFSCQDERHSEIIPVDHNVLATSTGIQPNLGAYDLPLEPSIVKNNSKFSQSSETKVPESSLPFAEAAPIPSTESEDLMTFSCFEDRLGGSNIQNDSAHESSFNDEKLSASMQSLVDGLMNWGGGFEADEEHFTLPVGMAADIALESSHVLGSSFHV